MRILLIPISSQSEREKTIKFMSTAVYCVISPHFKPAINHFVLFCFLVVTNKLATGFFYGSVLLSIINFVITLSRFSVEIARFKVQ